MTDSEIDPVGACAPEAETSAAFQDSLSRFAAKIPEVESRIAALETARGEALLADSPASVRAIETQIADARLSIERMRAWVVTIERRIPGMIAKEKVAAVRALVAQADTQTATVCHRFRNEYPAPAALIASILADYVAADAARARAVHAFFRDPEVMREAGVALPVSPDILPVGYASGGGFPALIANLPAVNPPGETLRAEYSRFWPPAAIQKAPEPATTPPAPAAPYQCAPVIEFTGAPPDFVTVTARAYSGPIPGLRGLGRR